MQHVEDLLAQSLRDHESVVIQEDPIPGVELIAILKIFLARSGVQGHSLGQRLVHVQVFWVLLGLSGPPLLLLPSIWR